jgi:8-oxo-dGTP pyrophosphatase MutT (NUDIX family)
MRTAFIGVIDENGRCLVVQNKQSKKWMMPGGVVDPNEEFKDAAIRELQEEAGVIIKNGPQVMRLTSSDNPCHLYQTVIISADYDFHRAFANRSTQEETINFGFVDLLQPGNFKVVSHEHDRFTDETAQHLRYLRDSLKQTPLIFNDVPNCDAFKHIVDNTSDHFKSVLNRTRFIACVPQETPSPEMNDPELCNLYVAQHIFLTKFFDDDDDEQFKEDMRNKDTQQSPYVCMGPDSIEFTVRENRDNCLSAVKSYVQDRRDSNGDFKSVIPELEAFYEVWKEIDSFKTKAAQMTLLAFLSAFYYTKDKNDVLSKKEDHYDQLSALLAGSKIPLLGANDAFFEVIEGIPKQYGFAICASILSVDDFIGLEKVDESWAFSELKKSESVEVVSVDKDDQRRICFPRPRSNDPNPFSLRVTETYVHIELDKIIADEDCINDPIRDALRNCIFTTKRSIYRRCSLGKTKYINKVNKEDDDYTPNEEDGGENIIDANLISDLEPYLLFAMSSLSVLRTKWAWSTGNGVAPL